MATSSNVISDCVLVEWVEDATLSVENLKQVQSKDRPVVGRVYGVEYRGANGRITVYQGKILRVGGE